VLKVVPVVVGSVVHVVSRVVKVSVSVVVVVVEIASHSFFFVGFF
jgi:hypothetical protein